MYYVWTEWDSYIGHTVTYEEGLDMLAKYSGSYEGAQELLDEGLASIDTEIL